MAVALGALGVFAALVMYAASRDVEDLAREERAETAADVAEAAATAYERASGWEGADLDTVVAVGRAAGATVRVIDASDSLVGAAGEEPSGVRVSAADVVADGERVGAVRVAFASSDLPTPARHLRDALGVSAAAARRITRPLTAVTATVRAVTAGDRTARVGDAGAAGELGELGDAFDRMADALASEDAARRAFVADIAHELRTPLTILRGTLEGLTDGVVDPSPTQLASLHDDALRLTRVVEDLETLASADVAGLSLQFGIVDLALLAHDTIARLAPQFEAADVALSLRATQTLVRADSLRLGQVLTNLLTNSLKFTPEGGTVAVAVERDGQTARLVVTDSGVGIPSEEQDRIFDRFWRGQAALAVAGSGIGLTVAAELVSAHGGDIRVRSQPGGGTRMTVTLPAG